MGRVFFNTRKNIHNITESYSVLDSDSGKFFALNSAANCVITLPTDANVTLGWHARFYVETANDASYTITTGDDADSGGDDFVGVVLLGTTTAGDTNAIAAAANDYQIFLDANLADTGGEVGSYVDIVKLAANEWHVSGIIYSDDTNSDGSAIFQNN